jgi:hypothetical protein
VIEPREVGSSFAAAHAALGQPDFRWVTGSALTERAYWLGLYHGLTVLHDGDALSEEAFRRLRQCVSLRPGDDGFGDSPFAQALELMREAIEDPRQPELETLDAAVASIVAHVAEVQDERTRAIEGVTAVVEAVRPFTVPDAFRVLSAEEHAHLQELVDSLEERLRVLARVELRWGRRLGVEGEGVR